MTLIARVAATGQEVESFSTSPEVWAEWRKYPVGTFVIGRQNVPAHLKRSILGLQFFAAAPGYGGSTAPETIEHQVAKIQLVQGMRSAGYTAKVEHPGSSPAGEEWQADVFVQGRTGPIAVEVQLSRQHWDDYRSRTERYKASGVSVVWLIRGTHTPAVHTKRQLHLMAQGMSKTEAFHRALDDMPCIPLHLEKDNPHATRATVHPFGMSPPIMTLPLSALGAGIASGALRMGMTGYLDGSRTWLDWIWDSASDSLPTSISAE